MPLVYITRRERFNAAHKLWNEQWSEEKNMEIFGKCANQNWHGHNYDLYVTVKGQPDLDTGCVMDLKVLSKILKETVIDKLDHRNLNLDVPFLKGKMSSTENLAVAIWGEIKTKIESEGCQLHSVRLHETENNFAEYFGEE
jgi:6-pyruvoyltetrahydropterin/6-carboxytetrahydropterin synthase